MERMLLSEKIERQQLTQSIERIPLRVKRAKTVL